MFWNTSEETAFPELNLKLIVYILFNNIFFQIHILLQISCHFFYVTYMHWQESTPYEEANINMKS